METDISRAASSFAKDSTLIKYSWRNEKATFTEKNVEIRTDKLPGIIMVSIKLPLDVDILPLNLDILPSHYTI